MMKKNPDNLKEKFDDKSSISDMMKKDSEIISTKIIEKRKKQIYSSEHTKDILEYDYDVNNQFYVNLSITMMTDHSQSLYLAAHYDDWGLIKKLYLCPGKFVGIMNEDIKLNFHNGKLFGMQKIECGFDNIMELNCQNIFMFILHTVQYISLNIDEDFYHLYNCDNLVIQKYIPETTQILTDPKNIVSLLHNLQKKKSNLSDKEINNLKKLLFEDFETIQQTVNNYSSYTRFTLDLNNLIH